MPGRWSARSRNADARGRLHVAALHVGVLHGVDVDGLAVRVHRPARRPGRDRVAAVERRGVVGRHRRGIAAAERVDRFHTPDREPLVRTARRTPRAPDRTTRRVHDHRAGVRLDRRNPSTTCAARAVARARPGSRRDTTTRGRPRSRSTHCSRTPGHSPAAPKSESAPKSASSGVAGRVSTVVVVDGRRGAVVVVVGGGGAHAAGPTSAHGCRARRHRRVQRTDQTVVARFRRIRRVRSRGRGRAHRARPLRSSQSAAAAASRARTVATAPCDRVRQRTVTPTTSPPTTTTGPDHDTCTDRRPHPRRRIRRSPRHRPRRRNRRGRRPRPRHRPRRHPRPLARRRGSRGIGPAQQVIAVAAGGYGTGTATVTAYERDASGWKQVFGPWAAYIGRNGVAPIGAKREGDGRTPSGVYGFDFMFGVDADPGVHFPFRRITGSNIVWDDDPASRELQRVDRHATPRRRARARSRWTARRRTSTASVIAYNDARTPGLGSAIFLHVSHGSSTAGCVSLPVDQLLDAAALARPGPLARASPSGRSPPSRHNPDESSVYDFLMPARPILISR